MHSGYIGKNASCMMRRILHNILLYCGTHKWWPMPLPMIIESAKIPTSPKHKIAPMGGDRIGAILWLWFSSKDEVLPRG